MAVQNPDLVSNGIKLGDGRLHPFLDLELRYDSYAGLNEQTGPFAELLAHFRPGLRFDLPLPNFDFTIGGDADYVLYTGILKPGDLANFSRLDYGANLSAAINRPGAIELDLNDTLSHNDRTRNAATTVGVLSLYNEVRAAVPIHPGGRALEITPHGAFALENFTPLDCENRASCPDPTNVAIQDYQNINFGLDASLRFLPKTALVLQTGVDMRNYPNDPGLTSNRPTTLLNATAGLQGLVTSRIAVVLRVGYGYDFLGTNASTVIGSAEISYLPTDLTTLKAGFTRVYQPVPVFGTYLDDRPYVEARTLLGGRLALHAYVAYDLLDFSNVKGAQGTVRHDQVLSVDAGPEYEFTRWLIGSLGVLYSKRISDAAGLSNLQRSLTSFDRFEGFARLTFTY